MARKSETHYKNDSMDEQEHSAESVVLKSRSRRLAYAFASGIASKVLGIAIQLIAYPLALHALGTQRYAAFLALQSLLAWTGLFGLGIVPSLPRFVSKAQVQRDQAGQRNLFVATIASVGTLAFCLFVLLLVAGELVSPRSLVAANEITDSELAAAFRIFAAINCLQLVLTLLPAFRSGYQELHYTFLWSAAANIAVLVALLVLSTGATSISEFFIALNLPLIICMALDSVLLIFQRPFLVRGRVNVVSTVRELAPNALNVLAMQSSYFALAWLPTVIVSHLAGATATAAFGSLMQLFVLANTAFSLIIQPLVPAIANANIHGDGSWIRNAYIRAARGLGLMCGIGVVAAMIAGPFIIHLWLGRDLGVSRTLAGLLAIYFTLWTSSVFHFNVLAALGNVSGIAKVYVTEGLLSVLLGSTFTYYFGAEGMAAGLVLAILLVSFWYMPLRTIRHIKLI